MQVVNLLKFLNSVRDLYTLDFAECSEDLINFLEQKVNTIYKEYISTEESQNEIFKGLTKIYRICNAQF